MKKCWQVCVTRSPYSTMTAFHKVAIRNSCFFHSRCIPVYLYRSFLELTQKTFVPHFPGNYNRYNCFARQHMCFKAILLLVYCRIYIFHEEVMCTEHTINVFSRPYNDSNGCLLGIFYFTKHLHSIKRLLFSAYILKMLNDRYWGTLEVSIY